MPMGEADASSGARHEPTTGPGAACALHHPPSEASVLNAVAGLALSDRSSSSSSLGEQGGAWSEASSSPRADSPCSSPGSRAHAGWRPSAAHVAASTSAPLLVAAHPGLDYQRIHSHDPRNLPVNDAGSPIEFDTPLLSGRACVWVRGLPGAPAEIFEGRRRRSLVTVQGRFKRPVGLDELVTGQEFGGVSNLPARWLVEGVLVRVARALTPSCTIGPLSSPHMLMPVAAGCAEMCASLPGQEPDPAAPPREDLRAWDASLAAPDGSPLPAGKRKAHFSKAANRAGRCFPTDLIFTFYFYQHVVDVARYELDVGVHKFNLCKYLDGQPLQLMMRTRGGEFAYCLHLWHAGLLSSGAGQQEQSEAPGAAVAVT